MGCQSSKVQSPATVDKSFQRDASKNEPPKACCKEVNGDSTPAVASEQAAVPSGTSEIASEEKILNNSRVEDSSQQLETRDELAEIGSSLTPDELPIEDQIQNLPESVHPDGPGREDQPTRDSAATPATSEIENDDTGEEWHHSIKVDQLALKLQFLSTEWADTREHVHYCD